jgi:amidophosphoribosyltransferase
LAGIVAVYNHGADTPMNIIYYLTHSMRMLQHRGKAYWKMAIGNAVVEREGSLPSDENILKIAKKQKLLGDNGIGYLSKRSPQFPSMKLIQASIDGFFVDTEKLYLHPNIGQAKDSDSLFKIYQIFVDLLIKKQNPERAAEFLDRHLKGNMILKLHDHIYAYRNSSGFKPLVTATNKSKTLSIIASENSLRTSLIDMHFNDVDPGQLIMMSKENGLEVLADLSGDRVMMDPFEFIRESHVTAIVNGKSIYAIRKNIGKEQANFLATDIDIDSAYAEPDYTRPMTLGFSIEYQKYSKTFEAAEGIIKDRYDDSDHMIDFSEQISKNKLLTSGKSLKFIIRNHVHNKKIATIQGTIQTGGTVKETIYYLRQAGVSRIYVIVCYVPTVDGRQVGLYTQNRELIANKYIGEVSSIDDLNESLKKEINADAVYYNSPTILARGIGVSENDLWFPEWVRFLDYAK